jgi:hypothetical protein
MATLTTTRLGIPFPDGTERVMDGDNAMGAIATKVDSLGLGFAMAAGITTINMGGTAGATLAVTFPVGRFTQPPVGSAVVAAGSANYFASIASVTAAGFTLYCSHRDSTTTSTAILCHWTAVQMTPSSGAG